jgi:hypothetical protein
MKRVLLTGIMAAALIVAAVTKAEAVTSLTVRICQGGALCQTFGPAPGPGPFTNNNIVVGDYTISGSVSTLENPLGSNAATSTIAIQRVGTANAGALEIYLIATNFNNPLPPNYDITSVLAATGVLRSSWFQRHVSGLGQLQQLGRAPADRRNSRTAELRTRC